MLPSKGTCTGCRNGLTRSLWSSTWRTVKSCSWEEQPQVHAEGWQAGRQLGRKGPQCFGGHQMKMNQQCVHATKKAIGILGCVSRSAASRWMEVICPLYLAVVMPSTVYHVQCWAAQYERDMQVLRLQGACLSRRFYQVTSRSPSQPQPCCGSLIRSILTQRK